MPFGDDAVDPLRDIGRDPCVYRLVQEIVPGIGVLTQAYRAPARGPLPDRIDRRATIVHAVQCQHRRMRRDLGQCRDRAGRGAGEDHGGAFEPRGHRRGRAERMTHDDERHIRVAGADQIGERAGVGRQFRGGAGIVGISLAQALTRGVQGPGLDAARAQRAREPLIVPAVLAAARQQRHHGARARHRPDPVVQPAAAALEVRHRISRRRGPAPAADRPPPWARRRCSAGSGRRPGCPRGHGSRCRATTPPPRPE